MADEEQATPSADTATASTDTELTPPEKKPPQASKPNAFQQASKQQAPPKQQQAQAPKPDPKQKPASTASHKCRLVESYVKQYTDHMSKSVLTDRDLENGARLLSHIITLLSTCDDKDAFDAFYAYMVSEKNRLMSERFALRGITSLDQTLNARTSVGYSLFREHVTKGHINEYNTKSAAEILGGANIITYLKEKTA